jgi:hypothetical protein
MNIVHKYLEKGSRWLHKNGEIYLIYDHTNINTTREDYPVRISYKNEMTGETYSREASKWLDSFTRLENDGALESEEKIKERVGYLSKLNGYIDLDFEHALAQLLNKYSKDNDVNIPDFILAQYLIQSIEALATCLDKTNQFKTAPIPSKDIFFNYFTPLLETDIEGVVAEIELNLNLIAMACYSGPENREFTIQSIKGCLEEFYIETNLIQSEYFINYDNNPLNINISYTLIVDKVSDKNMLNKVYTPSLKAKKEV